MTQKDKTEVEAYVRKLIVPTLKAKEIVIESQRKIIIELSRRLAVEEEWNELFEK